jgi:hypothetical protein
VAREYDPLLETQLDEQHVCGHGAVKDGPCASNVHSLSLAAAALRSCYCRCPPPPSLMRDAAVPAVCVTGLLRGTDQPHHRGGGSAERCGGAVLRGGARTGTQEPVPFARVLFARTCYRASVTRMLRKRSFPRRSTRRYACVCTFAPALWVHTGAGDRVERPAPTKVVLSKACVILRS